MLNQRAIVLALTLMAAHTANAGSFICQTWPNARADTPHDDHIAAWFKENNIDASSELKIVMKGLTLWDFADMTETGKIAIVINAKLTAKEANKLSREMIHDAPGFIAARRSAASIISMGKRAVADVEERGYQPDKALQKIIKESIYMIEHNQDAANSKLFDAQYEKLSTAYSAWDASHKGWFHWFIVIIGFFFGGNKPDM